MLDENECLIYSLLEDDWRRFGLEILVATTVVVATEQQAASRGTEKKVGVFEGGAEGARGCRPRATGL